MAHECIHCGSECYCNGDVSDSVDSLPPDGCVGCDGCFFEDMHSDVSNDEEDDEDEHWMCSCGNFITNGLHCPTCGAEPPWGCPCSMCQEGGYNEYDEDDFYDGLNDFQ